MAQLLQMMLFIHIASGFLAFITGFLSMSNRKGSSPHRLTGKLFFAGMSGVFVTSTLISAAKNIPFLFMVGFFSYYLACAGYRSLYLKKLHLGQRPAVIDWVISLTGLLAGLGMVLFSVSWFDSRGAMGIVPLLFGIFCMVNSILDIRNYRKPPRSKNHWIITHGSRMGGSFAAAVTAFVVVNFSLGSYTWVLWVLPGVAVGFWIRKTITDFLTRPSAPRPHQGLRAAPVRTKP